MLTSSQLKTLSEEEERFTTQHTGAQARTHRADPSWQEDGAEVGDLGFPFRLLPFSFKLTKKPGLP